jgi:hypothetical protein
LINLYESTQTALAKQTTDQPSLKIHLDLGGAS